MSKRERERVREREREREDTKRGRLSEVERDLGDRLGYYH